MFKQGVSVLILAVFVLLVSGCVALPLLLAAGAVDKAVDKAKKQKQQESEKREQEQREQQERKRLAVEQARGYIEVVSDVAGAVLLNGRDTTRTISLGETVTLTIENARGEYEISVRDSSGKVWQANKIISLTGGSREIAIVEDPKYVTSPNDFEFIQNTSGGLTITGYKGNHQKLVIPETISGVRVTAIGKNAFSIHWRVDHNFQRGLNNVVIPNTVTVIEDGAFESSEPVPYGYGVHNLGSLVIPDSVLSIGKKAFRYSNISSLTMGNKLTTIEDDAFSYNRLESINFPNSLKTIGNRAFMNNQLTIIIIPNGVTYNIGYEAFKENPITTIVIPSSMAKGFSGAFSGSTSKGTSITLPANVDNENLTTNFDQSFVNYYISQNKRAGTYTQENGIWKLTTPR
jgi:Sec-independent protein translocase protein TatA